MKSFVLIKDRKDGRFLVDVLQKLSSDFSSIKCYTKEDIKADRSAFIDAEFIFSSWYMPIFSKEEVRELFPSLKALFYAAGTVKYFAKPFLESNVKVYSSAMANCIPVAEFVVAQIILANKGYFQAQRTNKSIMWRLAFKRARGFSENRIGNYGATVGLIGCGRVGTEVVKLLRSYNLSVYIYDPYISTQQCQELGVVNLDLQTLFETCDVISNHLPDIHETQGIINYNLLSRMKDYATFINTGRGNQLVEKDLARVLRERPSICALLDVAKHEPLLPWSPLLRRSNLFISPHIAGSQGNEKNRLVEFALTAYDAFNHSKSSIFEVTAQMLDKMA